MSSIRLLNTGEWNKPPVLTAARRLLIKGLATHFPKTALGNMASFVNGTSYDTGKLSGDGTPIIRISNITNPESDFLKTTQEFDSRFLAYQGDLLVSWSASFKSIIWPKERGIVNQHIFKVTEAPGYYRGFIRHTIEAVFDDLQTNVVGIGMKHLRRRDFLEHAVPNPDPQTQELVSNYLDWLENQNGVTEPPLPPQLSEQRRIVGRLEHLASKIEEARGLRRKSSAEVEALAVSARHEAFSKLAASVEPIRLDSVANTRLGKMLSKEAKKGTNPTPYMRNANVQWDRLDLSSVYEMDFTEEERRKFALQDGDILACEGGDIGKSAIWSDEIPGCCYQKALHRIRVDRKKLFPRFMLYHIFWAAEQRHFEEIKTQTTIPHLTGVKLNAYPVFVPSLAEQSAIVERLDSLTSKANLLRQLQAQTRAELDALLPSVLDKAFHGEL